MTSNQHGPYVRGYTRVTMGGTEAVSYTHLGISKYPPLQARIAYEMMAKAGVPCLISQYQLQFYG